MKKHTLFIQICMLLFTFLDSIQAQQSRQRGNIAEAGSCNQAIRTTYHDQLHPTYFVNVVEISEGDTLRYVHSTSPVPRPADGIDGSLAQPMPAHRRSYTEVDDNSIIDITFDRRRMLDAPNFQANLKITGTLNGRPIEVPAYSLVGKEAGESEVKIGVFLDVFTAICSLETRRGAITAQWTQVDDAIRTAEDAYLARAAASKLADTLRQLRGDTAILSSELTRATTAADSVRISTELASRLNEITQLQSSEQYLSGIVADYSPTVIPGLLTTFDYFRTTLESLTRPENRATLELLARRTGRSASGLRLLAERVQAARLDTLTLVSRVALSRADLVRRQQAISEVREGLGEIFHAVGAYLALLREANLQNDPALFENLRDTQLSLRTIDAKPGDRLVLNFENALAAPGSNRALSLDVRVRRFGWVSDVSDSFIFLRRIGANYRRNPSRVAAAESEIAPGEERVIQVSEGYNFDLTPGVAYYWTHYSRDNARSLMPSLGINVAFAKFHTKIYTLRRPAATENDPNPEITRREESLSNTLDIGVGLYGGLYDGAIGVTVGRAITVERDPWYFGLNLSFLKLAKNAARLFPTT